MSLKRLSSQFHLSVSAISNIFKAVNGINFSDYLISLRMAKAKRLFFEMGYAPAEIGRLVGYASEYSFRRAFSRNEGCRLQEWCAKNHITGSR